MLKRVICAWGGLALLIASCVAGGGLAPFLDVPSFFIVTFGGLLYAFAKLGFSPFLITFGRGAVYFGWLAFVTGLILILVNTDLSSENGIQLLPYALAVSILPILYGYLFRVLTMFLSNDVNS